MTDLHKRLSDATEGTRGHTPGPWGPGGSKVKEAVKGLTRREREIVGEGYINGGAKAQTVRSLQHKGMFYLRITSPNGQCGSMELTPLGVNARALIIAKATDTGVGG